MTEQLNSNNMCIHIYVGFPGGSGGKESACNAGFAISVLRSGRSPGGGNGNQLQYSCLGNPMERGAWRLLFTGSCSRAAAPVCAFSRGTTARSVSLSWGAREVGSPCEWRGRAPHCSRAMVGCRGPAPADPGYSKERRRRRRSGNHCLIKC